MNRLLPLILITLGCTTVPAGAPAAPAPPQSLFKNLQVFPQDIPKEELINSMRVFTRSLGVRCNECHVVTATEPKEVLDFASDAKEEKKIARVMLRMTTELNRTWLARVEEAEGHAEAPKPMSVQEVVTSGDISCWTCHRGKKEPEEPPPPQERPAS